MKTKTKWVSKKGFSAKRPPGYDFNGKVPKRFRKKEDFYIRLFQEFWEQKIKNDPRLIEFCEALYISTDDLDQLIIKLKPKVEEFFEGYSETERLFLVSHVVVFDLVRLKRLFNTVSKKRESLTQKEFLILFFKEREELLLGLINYYLFKHLMLGTTEDKEKIAYTWGIVENLFCNQIA